MFTILLLACKSDQGLQDNNQNPGRSLDQEACECPDNTAEVAALQDELRSVLDRVVTLESAPAPEIPASTVVVTEYEVMCTAGRDINGNFILTDPFTTVLPSGETIQVGCRVAMIDPNDRPYIINIGTLWDYSIDEENSPYYTWETGPRFAPFHFDALDVGMGTLIMPDGAVISQAIPGYANQTDRSSGEGVTVDLPVRVVIIDDKPALRPEAW